MPNLSTTHQKSIEQRPKINETASLERFRRQIAPRSAPGRFREFGVIAFWHLFGRKWCSKGPFWSPAGTQNRLTTALLGLDRRRVPRKMISRRGVGKNMKSWWKIDAKMNAFWWLGTTFGVILFAYFTLSPFSKKVKKSMLKGCQKACFLYQEMRVSVCDFLNTCPRVPAPRRKQNKKLPSCYHYTQVAK